MVDMRKTQNEFPQTKSMKAFHLKVKIIFIRDGKMEK